MEATATATPTLIACGYDGTLLVSAQWDPVPGSAQFVVGVLDADGNVVRTGRGFGVVGSVTLDAPLTPSRTYYAAASVLTNGQQGPWGTQLLVLQDRLTALAAEYDGARELRASWTLPPGALPNAATLKVVDTTTRQDVAETVVQGSAGTIALGAPLDLGHAYELRASATFGGSTGPAAALPLVVASATVTGVEYGPAGPTLEVTFALPVPPGCVPGVALLGDGRLVTSGTGTGFVVRLTLGARLDPAVAWVVRPYWQAGTARGPYGLGADVMVDAPRIVSARWAGSDLELAWENAPGPPYPTGAQVEVSARGETTRGFVSPDPRRAVFPPNPALLPGSSYTATVAALRGVAEGPSSAGVPVLAGTTALASAAYDGAALTATWSGTPPPGASTGRLVVRDGVATVAQIDASGTTARVPVALNPATAYTAALMWTASAAGAVSEGPLGPALALIGGAPELASAVVANGHVTLGWHPADAPSGVITGYEAVFASPGLPPVAVAITAQQPSVAIPALSPDPLVPPTVAVRATGTNVRGPLSNALPVLRSAPAIGAVALREDGLHVEWAPLPDEVEAYVATLLQDGRPLATQTVRGTSAVLAPGTIAPASVYTVSVVARAGGAAGPAPGTLPRALLSGPTLGAASFDGTTLSATVTAPGGGAPATDRYVVELLRDGVVVQRATLPPPATGRPLALAVADDVERDGGVLQLAVRAASGIATGPPATGPALLARAALEAVSFDGLTVRVAWRGVAGATGYHLSVMADGQSSAAQTDAGAEARALRFPVTLPNTTSAWQVTVQARAGGGGPLSSAPLFSPGIYLRSDGQPRLFHAASLARVPVALTAYLPEIGPLTRLPIPDAIAPAPPFAIVANTDARSRAAFPYCLQIAGAALDFSSGTAIRADVRAAYDALLSMAELRGATPWGIVQLQQVIARLLPQTFAETLLYAYGLSPTGGSADLRPGLVLRVASAPFDLMPSNRPPVWSSGYAAGATTDYEIGDYLDGAPQPADATWLLGFDAFLSWLTSCGALTVPGPQSEGGGIAAATDFAQSGAAEAADLYYPTFRQPFYRLFVPSRLQAATPPAVALTAQQFTLAAAGTHALIAGAGPAPSPGVAVAYFRGRTVVKLAIRVVVNGEEQLVPLGTTVGNVLDRLARRPPHAATALRGLRLERSLGPAVLDPAAYDAGASAPVRLDFGGLATFDRRDALSLPLLHGDRLTLGDEAA